MNRTLCSRLLSLSGNGDQWLRRLVGLLALLLIVKLTVGALLLSQHAPPLSLPPSTAHAQETTVDLPPASQARPADNGTDGRAPTALGDDYSWKYELVSALRERDAVLSQREALLREEERRVSKIKQEVEKRIETLQKLQNEIAALIDQQQTAENEKVRKLAKVFEETPPEQAGPLLSRLDVDIAAQLLLKMNGRKAGRIWGYVDPAQAVMISKELARLQPDNALTVGQ